ncbi:flagellar biosynthesis anti-sigma factor FlgM [Massilia oculi]|uniref:Negative regulator of flagellin synthesis n=2 Tax=Massilia TaxID=149698 RepID=A0A422QRN6_9BURK|nr:MULTISPECIES: flagellar biosynthesis anti-sigma factor FlgM [Massilia]AWL04375.1 flagellar biosynthesis anti-sigma factor FlgM [Massilia oculi]MDY0962689.1 flagellar biosynthesis anti-sigma factor FlgM [Massilia sp. CFBP9026]RNF32615.1 flagellar biosynthesis anti-sigma factor FlgM [Massilia aurea]
MKITGSSVSTVTIGAQTVSVPVQAEAPAAPAAALQSEVLKPAAEAMRAMPDFDAARVAELRDALARGELPFDPGRLAGLIQKFHGGR